MAQIGEVRAENGRGDDSWRGHDVCMYGGKRVEVEGVMRTWRGGGVIKKKNSYLKLSAIYISGEEWICSGSHRTSRNILGGYGPRSRFYVFLLFFSSFKS